MTPRDEAPLELYTIGHSVLTLEEFIERLRSHEIAGLADVRRFPASRRHPHFNREVLQEALALQGIDYRWFEGLGGRRSTQRGSGKSPNAGLRVVGFRAYADYGLTPDFAAALGSLLDWAAERRVAVCCAEALWWQCHRRIIADHAVARSWQVVHIRGGQLEPHVLWELARLSPHGPVYPPPQSDLFQERRRRS